MNLMEAYEVSAGQTIFSQNEQGDWFYVIKDGTFDVMLTRGDKPEVWCAESLPFASVNHICERVPTLIVWPVRSMCIHTSHPGVLAHRSGKWHSCTTGQDLLLSRHALMVFCGGCIAAPSIASNMSDWRLSSRCPTDHKSLNFTS